MIREKLMLKTQDNTIQSSGWQNTQNVAGVISYIPTKLKS